MSRDSAPDITVVLESHTKDHGGEGTVLPSGVNSAPAWEGRCLQPARRTYAVATGARSAQIDAIVFHMSAEVSCPCSIALVP
jgi:hypothetical protein